MRAYDIRALLGVTPEPEPEVPVAAAETPTPEGEESKPLAPVVPIRPKAADKQPEGGIGGALHFERKTLVHILTNLGRAIGVRSALPILQGCHVKVEGDQVTLTATDLDRFASWWGVTDHAEGVWVMPLKATLATVKAGVTPTATLRFTDGEVVVDGDVRLRLFDADSYPKLGLRPTNKVVAILDNEAVNQANRVAAAASTDDARPLLTGIRLDSEAGNLRFVATDSYRLAVAETKVTPLGEYGQVVPAELFKRWRQLHGAKGDAKATVTVANEGRDLDLTAGSWTLGTRCIEGNYPNYRALLPTSQWPATVHLDVEEAIRLLIKARVLAEDHIPVRFDLSASEPAVLSVTRQDVGGASMTIANAWYEGDDMTVAFNSKYFLDGLKACGSTGQIRVEMIDPLKPGLMVAGDDFRYLIMPVRL